MKRLGLKLGKMLMESGLSEMGGRMGKWHSKALENKGTWGHSTLGHGQGGAWEPFPS